MFGLPLELILGVVSVIGGFIMKLSAQRQADYVELIKLAMRKNATVSSDLADAAQKRSDPKLRKIIALIIILICFGGIFVVAFIPSIPVTIIEPVAQKSFLGLFKWGKTYEIITASGLVFPTWVKFSVVSIVGFVFGTGAAKINRQ